MPESRHPRPRDLQIRFPRSRRVRGLALAHLQFRVHDCHHGHGYRDLQQGAEEFHGYGVGKRPPDVKDTAIIDCYLTEFLVK